MGIVKRTLGHRSELHPRLELQITFGQLKGRTPDPAPHISDGRPSSKRLSECLGHGVGCDVLIARKGEQRSPKAITVIAVDGLDLARCSELCHGYRHTPIG